MSYLTVDRQTPSSSSDKSGDANENNDDLEVIMVSSILLDNTYFFCKHKPKLVNWPYLCGKKKSDTLPRVPKSCVIVLQFIYLLSKFVVYVYICLWLA